jgi:hypothetical protein
LYLQVDDDDSFIEPLEDVEYIVATYSEIPGMNIMAAQLADIIKLAKSREDDASPGP